MKDEFTIVMLPYFAELIVADMPDSVRNLRFDAMRQVQDYLHHYEVLGYMTGLLCVIAEKKCRYIMAATTKADMEQIIKPHCPHYDGNRFIPGPYSIQSRYGYDPKQSDLSRITDWESFVGAMNYAMMKQYASMEKGGRMAVLMGDIKKKGRLYSMLAEIVKPGTLENIIIKAQHNCFSDKTRYSGSFIPILHEYVMIVRKDNALICPILISEKKQADIRDIPGATWRDVVAAVLEQCDEAVPLTYLYGQIEPYQKVKGHKWWKEKIRQTLQYHPEHFQHAGRGLWKLRTKTN